MYTMFFHIHGFTSFDIFLRLSIRRYNVTLISIITTYVYFKCESICEYAIYSGYSYNIILTYTL